MKALRLLLIVLVGVAQVSNAQRMWDGIIATSYAGGTGSSSNPYLISNAAEFALLLEETANAKNYSGYYFELTNDIVFNIDYTHDPISRVGNGGTFSGSLDGKFHRIIGMNCFSTSNSSRATYMFAQLDGTINNLGIVGMTYGQCGFSGEVGSTGLISNSYFEGKLNFYGEYDCYLDVSGFTHQNEGLIENSYVRASTNMWIDYGFHPHRYAEDNRKGIFRNCHSYLQSTNGTFENNQITNFEYLFFDGGGTSENLTNDVNLLNEWVESHGSYYSSWEEEDYPVLSGFKTTLNEQYTVTFDPNLGECPESSRIVSYGDSIMTFPTPTNTKNLEFIGWYYSKEKATPGYPIYGNITLNAKWNRKILEQPTSDSPTINVSDIEHAIFKWYKKTTQDVYIDLSQYNVGQYGWNVLSDGSYVSSNKHRRSTSSKAEIPLSVNKGDILKVKYSVSSEKGFDYFRILWNGNVLMDKSGVETEQIFEYVFEESESGVLTVSYSKDSSDDVGDDCAIVHSCIITSKPIDLDCSSVSLDMSKVSVGDKVYCEVSYTNDDAILVSDTFTIGGDFSFVINGCEINKREVIRVPVVMHNESGVISFQCDVTLSPEIEFGQLGDVFAIEKSERFGDSHTLEFSQIDDFMRIVSVSMQNQPYSGEDGPLFYLLVKAANNTEVGSEATITISNINLTKTDFTAPLVNDASATFTVNKYYVEGDVNDDGKYTVLDISMIVAYIMNQNPENGVKEAADVNSDGRITVSDISILVSYILDNLSPTAMKSPNMYGVSGDCDELTNLTIYNNSLKMELTNADKYTSMQFDVLMSEGASVTAINVPSTHVSDWRDLGNGTLRAVIYSPNNECFNTSNIAEIGYTGDGGLCSISNVILATNEDGKFIEATATDCSASIDSSSIGDELANVSGLKVFTNGNKLIVYSPIKQKIEISSANGISSVFEVEFGRNEFILPCGVYIVDKQKILLTDSTLNY